MKKSTIWTIAIIIAIILFSYFVLNRTQPTTDEEIAKCIGENSILYVQLGCHACQQQEEMFGKNYKYLNKIDCFFEREKCDDIQFTPTWIINGEKYEEAQSIEKLKELTGC